MKYLSEIARIQSDEDKQTARDKVTKARKTITAATKAYKTAKSASSQKGSPSRKRAAKYLKDALNQRRVIKKNVKKALEPKTEET